MTDMQVSNTGRPSRRLFLAGGLAVAFGATACGRTVLSGEPTPAPSNSPSTSPADLTGSYAITDPATGARVEVTVTESLRVIQANGLPNHATGAFPNPNNPNSIAAQAYTFELPRHPTLAGRPSALVLPQPFGVAVNGVVFDPLAAEWYERDRDSGWTLEAIGPGRSLGLDANLAHVQPTGAYHYHGLPTALAGRHAGSTHSPLLGWAGDGFPIYGPYGYADPADPASGVAQLRPSYRLRTGRRSGGPGGAFDGTYTEDFEFIDGLGDLDVANGRFAVTPEYPQGAYHYVLTSAFPFVPRYFAGAVAASFVRSPGPGGQR
jgi:hypothetical protein